MRCALTAVVALAVMLVSCEKDPATESSNIITYVEALEAQPEGETLRVNYSIAKPAEGIQLEVACSAEWVSVDVVTGSFFDLTVAKNDTANERTTKLTLGYGNDTKTLTLSQKAWEAPLVITVDRV